MKGLNAYLTFDGNARDAMQFYAGVFRAELHITDGSEMPGCPPAQADKVLHARLEGGPILLMASDNMSENPSQRGNNVSLGLDCSTAEEQARLFAALSEGGTVTMPLQDTFWGAHFGMLTDRFGMHWLLNLDH